MASRRVSSKVIGIAKVRAKLQRMPLEIRAGVSDAITTEANIVANEIRNNVPYDADSLLWNYGSRQPRKHLRDAIQVRTYRNGLIARIGFITKKVREVYWFARLLEYGFYPGNGGTFVQREFFLKSWLAQQSQARAHIKRAAKEAFDKVARL